MPVRDRPLLSCFAWTLPRVVCPATPDRAAARWGALVTLVLAGVAMLVLHAGAAQAQDTTPVVSLQPAGRGVRLQTDWSGYRFTVAPETTSENGLSLGGSVAGTLSRRAAAGVVFAIGADKRDLVANGSWRISDGQRLSVSLGQLRQDITLPVEGTTTTATMMQYAGGIGYALSTPIWRLDAIDVELYGSRSLSRALGDLRVSRDTGAEYELFSVPMRVAGASTVGLAARASIRPWVSGRLGLTFGRERLTYDFHTGGATHDRLASGVDWSQRLTGTYTLTARADTRAGQRVYEVGFSRSTARRQFGLSVMAVHGRDNGPSDIRIRWTHAFTFGEAAGGASAVPSTGPTAARSRALLDQVSRRPGFMPPQVVAQVDTTVPRKRLVAIERDGLPSSVRVDPNTGTVTLPQAVASIVSVTRNGRPFENAGQFVVAGSRLEVRAAAMPVPAAGATDEYVVTLTTPDERVTTVTVIASKGSVRINRVTVTTAAPQEMPDPLHFDAAAGVALGALVVSDAVTISGINVLVAVSVDGGEFAIDDGVFTSAPATIVAGQALRLRHRAAETIATRTVTTVTVGQARATFASTTEPGPAPGPFSFAPRLGVRVGDDVTSDPVMLTDLPRPAAVTVTGGTYAVDGGPFTASPGTIQNGQALTLRAPAVNTPATTTTVTVMVGSASAVFTVTTESADDQPDAFGFSEPTVDPGVTVESEPVTVTGINTEVLIAISGGAYSVNGSSYTTAANHVRSGDRVVVRTVSGETPGGVQTATLSIGGTSAAFVVTTYDAHTPADTTPDAFGFTAQTGIPVKTNVDSNAVTVTGIDASAPIEVSGGEYSIDGSAFTAATGTVSAGQTVTVRLRSSTDFSTTTTATLTIGGVTGTFSVITEAPDTTPDAFGFTAQTGVTVSTAIVSNTITISGINTDVPISVSGGEYAIKGNNYTSGAGTISNGDTLRLKQTSSSQFSATTTVTVTVGGVSAAFSATTEAEDSTPDGFSFSPLTNVKTGQTKQSEQITIGGINVSVDISVSGEPSSEYRVNNGAWTSAPGTVNDGDLVRVRHTAASTSATTTTTILTVGGVSGTFSVTTK